MILDPLSNVLMMTVTVILDVHHGYWLGSASRVSNISENILLTFLRVAQGLATFFFSHSLITGIIGVSSTNEMISALLSLMASASVALIMFRRDQTHGRLLAEELQEVKLELFKEFKNEMQAHFSSSIEAWNKFREGIENNINDLMEKTRTLYLDREKLIQVVASYIDEHKSLTTSLQGMITEMSGKEEMLDYMIQKQKALRNGRLGEESEKEGGEDMEIGAQSRIELTKEDGRANRLKGIKTQKELADMLKGWSLQVKSNYSGGPDEIVKYNDNKEAVFACRGHSLSEDGTKQRRISRDEIKAEFDYARRKKIPLIIAVKNLLTGKWWMHWVSAEELEDFEGISTPVILAEDSAEAIRTLEESVRSVKEKLVGVG
ncbi:MAG: hypothetical protein QXU32_10960 [Nitrososphaerales archaeon]